MSSLVRIVVGNNYAAFAQYGSVVTFSEIEHELERLEPQHILVAGQGLSDEQRAKLTALGASKPGPLVLGAEPLAPRELTHKALSANTLCSSPVRIPGTTTYRSTLQCASAVDRLADHSTGQHVNGMLLIEATRQAGTASIEAHFLQQDPRKWGFAWGRCDTRFLRFAFPVPTEIRVHMPEIPDFAQLSQIPMTVPIVAEQAGSPVCEVLMEVTLIEAGLLAKLETRKAKQTVAAVVSQAEATQVLAQPA